MTDKDSDRPRSTRRANKLGRTDGSPSPGHERLPDPRDEERPQQWPQQRSGHTIHHGRLTGVWPTLVLATALAVVLIYLSTHPYPAYGAGLYLKISEEILFHGYGLPVWIPDYTANGVPFAYSPLMFYVAAVVLDFGVEPLAVSRLLPALFTVTYSLVAYHVARDFLPTRRQAGVAAMLLAVTPDTLQWHLSAGGMVRGFGFLLTLLGLAVGVRLFRRGQWQWVVPGVALFGLTVLTHPVYTVFFGVTWILLYVFEDRSLPGLVAGAVVAGGGIVLTAPWWLQVVAAHGPGIFFAAAGTHSGLAGGLDRLLDVFVFVDVDVLLPFHLVSYAAAGWFLRRQRYFLPTWFVATGYVVGKDRFLFLMGSLMVAAFLFEGVVPWLRLNVRLPERRWAGTAVALSFVVLAAAAGGLFAAGAIDTSYTDSPTMPAFMDAEDRAAMEWIATHTDTGADFLVLGDAAEWLPLFADRTILVGYWGVEWTTPERFQRQVTTYETVSTCEDAACITGVVANADIDPDYLYVPKGEYTVRGKEYVVDERLHDSLADAAGYETVHRNAGVVVYRVRDTTIESEGADPDIDYNGVASIQGR